MQVFFTNWRYYKQYHSPLSANTQRDRGDNQSDYKNQIAKKKCFVYNKISYWSSKHTQKKH